MRRNKRTPTCVCLASSRAARTRILNNSNIPIDFWTQRTDPRAFPLKTWRRLILQSLASAGHNLTEYGDPCGLMALRTEIAEHVGNSRGLRVRPEQVVIVAGAQLALNLVLRLLATQGDEIIVENPCNQGAAYLFESLQLKLHPIDIDPLGIDASAVAGSSARLAYLTPSHQFPMGATLSLDRRRTILSWARQTGAYIIEDDYDCEFRYEGTPLPALMAMNSEHVIYLGTFSKSLGAGLRIGFAIFPDHLVDAAATAKALLDNGQVWLEQAALTRFMQSGGFVRHLRRAQQQYNVRRRVLIERLSERFGKVSILGAEAGTHIAWKLPESLVPAHKTKAIARARNIGIYTVQSGGGHEYNGSQFEENWLLLGYASLSENQIRAGVDRLADAIGPLTSSNLLPNAMKVPLAPELITPGHRGQFTIPLYLRPRTKHGGIRQHFAAMEFATSFVCKIEVDQRLGSKCRNVATGFLVKASQLRCTAPSQMDLAFRRLHRPTVLSSPLSR